MAAALRGADATGGQAGSAKGGRGGNASGGRGGSSGAAGASAGGSSGAAGSTPTGTPERLDGDGGRQRRRRLGRRRRHLDRQRRGGRRRGRLQRRHWRRLGRRRRHLGRQRRRDRRGRRQRRRIFGRRRQRPDRRGRRQRRRRLGRRRQHLDRRGRRGGRYGRRRDGKCGRRRGGTGGTLSLCGTNSGGIQGESCNDLVPTGPCVVPQWSNDPAPAPLGGTVVAGTYVLTSEIIYQPTDAGAFTEDRPRRETIVVSSVAEASFRIDQADGSGTELHRSGGTVVFANNVTLTYAPTCPPPGDGGDNGGSAGFTATASSFTIFAPRESSTRVQVFTKQ